MEKQEKWFDINKSLDWTYGIEIEKIKKDIEELEQLGATHIKIEPYESYGSAGVNITARVLRLENDLEFEERVKKEKIQQNQHLERELELLKRLKSKYES